MLISFRSNLCVCALAVIVTTLTACKDNKGNDELDLMPNTLTFNAKDDAVKNVFVISNMSLWTFDKTANWIKIQQFTDRLSISVDEHTGYDGARTGTVTVNAGNAPPKNVTVEQYGRDPDELNTVYFEKSGEAVLNPGKGWILYGSPGNQSAATIALGTTGYQRYDWTTLNPQEDVYNWSSLDNAINQWVQRGKQFCFGIMSVNTFGNVYATPKWVFDKGAKYTMGNGEGVESQVFKYFIPVWNDPVYVAACKKFADTLAARYDGNPNIAFIDIRNYGNWGENHMWPFERCTLPLKPEEVIELLFKPYIDAFKKTRLVIAHTGSVRNITYLDEARFDYDYESIKTWAVNQGMGLRRDGIMGPVNQGGNGEQIYMAFGETPVIWEFLGTFRNRETATDRIWNDNDFINNIKNNVPSFIGMGQWGDDAQYMLSKKEALIKQAANLMGFNFSMTSAKYTNRVSANEMQELSVTIENSGVTFIFTDCAIKLALVNDNDEVVSSYSTNWNIRNLKGGETATYQANVVFAETPAGTYKLVIGLFLHENDPTPAYNLDNTGKTRNGYYVIGNLTIM